MKPKELREFDEAGLKARLGELEEGYFELREAVATGKEKNHGSLKAARRDIARVKTIIKEKS